MFKDQILTNFYTNIFVISCHVNIDTIHFHAFSLFMFSQMAIKFRHVPNRIHSDFDFFMFTARLLLMIYAASGIFILFSVSSLFRVLLNTNMEMLFAYRMTRIF